MQENALIPAKTLNPLGNPYNETLIHCILLTISKCKEHVIFSRNCIVDGKCVNLNFTTTASEWMRGVQKYAANKYQ